LPEGLVPGVLLSLAVACSMNGHYDPQLLDRVAEQVRFSFRQTESTCRSVSASEQLRIVFGWVCGVLASACMWTSSSCPGLCPVTPTPPMV
jgi:hypothetical protein